MHFQLSDDQQMLKSLVERFVQDHYADGQRNTYLATPYGFSPETWSLLGELGIIATAFNEADGGFETDIKTLTVILRLLDAASQPNHLLSTHMRQERFLPQQLHRS